MLPFFKDTESYKFVTLLEQLEIENRYRNIFIYTLKLFKLDLTTTRKINKTNINHTKKIDLLISLFKERFYLEQMHVKYNSNIKSTLNYNIINNIIIAEIIYDNIIIHIEYGLLDDESSIYILNDNNKGINITKEDLNLKINYSILIDALSMLLNEVCLILGSMLVNTSKRMRRMKKNV